MSQTEEAMFKALVERAAPGERDALFRIRLLERRETEAFQRRTAIIATVMLVALGLSVLAVWLRPSAEVVGVGAGIALSAAAYLFAPKFLHRVSLLRNSR